MDTNEHYFADGARHLYVPRLNTLSNCSSIGLRAWLSESENYIPIKLPLSGCFEIDFYDISEALSALAHDIVRLTCASFETVDAISEIPNQRKFLAWQLVEYYYSAFYSAHSTLKICGFGLLQLNSQIIRQIKRRAETLGVELSQISQGVYCVNICPSESKMVFYLVAKYDDSHRGLWRRYYDFLNVLLGFSVSTGALDSNCIRPRKISDAYSQSVYAQLSQQDAEIVASHIDGVKNILNKNSDCNWLSWVRNSINYNHAFGIWYPYKTFKAEYEKLIPMRNLYRQNSLNESFASIENESELVQYVKCCQQINAFNMDLIKDLSVRHPENKSFLKNGPLAYLNLHALA